MLAPSGSFSTTPQALGAYASYDPEDANSWVTPVTFYNPYPIEAVGELTIEQADAKLMEAVSEDMKGGGVLAYTQEELEQYSLALTRMGARLKTFAPQLWISPLRGSHVPTRVLQAMGDHAEPFFLPFSGHGSTERLKAYRELLMKRLEQLVGGEAIRIFVSDTAEGGYGAVCLAAEIDSALREVAIDPSRVHIEFDLLAKQGHKRFYENLAQAESILKCFGSHGIRHELVSSTIAEDHDAALGVRVEVDGGDVLVRPTYDAGRLLVKKSSGEVQVIESENLHHSVTQRIAVEVTSVLKSHGTMLEPWVDTERRGTGVDGK
ncbi:MAG: hypothetical protein KC766_41550 [Myxococcales bacterium]|nr:hypothetical protein [Myxococcales bacterium]